MAALLVTWGAAQIRVAEGPQRPEEAVQEQEAAASGGKTAEKHTWC